MKLQPKNWEKFQHYKDRNPPWIKLHKDILDDYEWWCLPIASRALAPCLWLLASCYEDGIFDARTESLAFRFRMQEKEIVEAIKPLIDKGYFILASGMLADCKQLAMPETEKRREENITELSILLNHGVEESVSKDFIKLRAKKKAPVTETAINGIIKEVKKTNLSLTDALAICCKRGWQGFDASWLSKDETNKPRGLVL